MTISPPIIGFDPDDEAAFDQLLDAMVEARHSCRALERENPFSEQKRRELALADIKESLEGRPIECHSAASLEFISLLLAYWRVVENETGDASEPDRVQ